MNLISLIGLRYDILFLLIDYKEKIFHFNVNQIVNIENIFNERNYTFSYSTCSCIPSYSLNHKNLDFFLHAIVNDPKYAATFHVRKCSIMVCRLLQKVFVTCIRFTSYILQCLYTYHKRAPQIEPRFNFCKRISILIDRFANYLANGKYCIPNKHKYITKIMFFLKVDVIHDVKIITVIIGYS